VQPAKLPESAQICAESPRGDCAAMVRKWVQSDRSERFPDRCAREVPDKRRHRQELKPRIAAPAEPVGSGQSDGVVHA
jgi:hypothetical protein